MRKWNSSSCCLNDGLTGTTIAPRPLRARKLVTNARVVAQEQGHRVPGADPPGRQPAREPLDPLRELGVAHALVPVDERGVIRTGVDVRVQQPHQHATTDPP